jgi:hypothetical protein
MDGPICEPHPDYQREGSQVLGISLEERLNEQGQSSHFPDNQAATPSYFQGKSEGQPPEDTVAGSASGITVTKTMKGRIPGYSFGVGGSIDDAGIVSNG